MKCGTLFIVATPIGNLDDITLRAIEMLKSVDAIACEDTRVSRKLLDHFGIKKELISLHQHSSDKAIAQIIDRLNHGENIAYITDSGTPCISDPGLKLIQLFRGQSQISNLKSQNYGSGSIRSDETNMLQASSYNLDVIPIPGPSAVAAAVSVSGIIEKEFYFAGFLPKKKGRQTKMIELAKLDVPIIIYESALRLEKTLKDIEKYFGAEAEVFIAREMTKMFEEYWGEKVGVVIANLANRKLKGEVTIIVRGTKEN